MPQILRILFKIFIVLLKFKFNCTFCILSATLQSRGENMRSVLKYLHSLKLVQVTLVVFGQEAKE